ncbi:MAG: hypothetical protein M2R45_00122 [Verrucomicrobia subdivision 3 bacterium]|nr:hypothetical protein [Limisphaerales bacterium]MCS1412418.1 hypothetical protein [Limisphaerales bacterium]
MRINDGFIAYLNDEEVVRFNVPDELHWHSVSTGNMIYTARRMREFDLSDLRDSLREGKNLLALSAGSSMVHGLSFLVYVELEGWRLFQATLSGSARRCTELLTVSDAEQVQLRVKNGDPWGPLLVMQRPDQKGSGVIQISEMLFGVEGGPNWSSLRSSSAKIEV